MSSTPNSSIAQVTTKCCPDCGNPLDYYLQKPLSPKSTRPDYWIGTCENKACTLWKVTLADDSWTELASNPEMANKYRRMVTERREGDAALRAKFEALNGGAK